MKRHTITERQEILIEWEKSGQTAEDFCEAHEITVFTLNRWRQQHKGSCKPDTAFLPVTIIPESRKSPQTGACILKVGELFSIECLSTTSQRNIETVIQAVMKVCGLTCIR